MNVEKYWSYENIKATITSEDYIKNNWRMWNISAICVAWLTNDARCTHEIKFGTATAKVAFNRKEDPIP